MTQDQESLVLVARTMGSAIVIFLVIAIIAIFFYRITRKFDLTIIAIIILAIAFGLLGFGWAATIIAGSIELMLFKKYFKRKPEKQVIKKDNNG